MPQTGKSYAGESRIDRLRYSILLALRMLTPPFLSLKKMETTCKRLIEKNPDASTPRSFLADVYRFYNMNERACLEYEELCKRGSMSVKDKIRFAEVLFRLKNPSRVIEVSEAVVAEHPEDKNANWRLAVSFMEVGLHDRAAEYFKRSITAGNNRYEDYWRLGFCLAMAGQLNDALKAYNQGLEANPGSKGLKESVIWVESKMRKDSDIKLAATSSLQVNGTPPQPPTW
jgi:tetratricopeptide (TPR) repeat protein